MITLDAVAFVLLIGGQFTAVIAMSAARSYYPGENLNLPPQPTRAEMDLFHPSRPLGQWLIEA